MPSSGSPPRFFAGGLRVFLGVLIAVLITLSPGAMASPEFLVNEEVAPESAGAMVLPLDGFSEKSDTLTPGLFGREIGAYSPVFRELLTETVLELAPRSYYLYSSIDGVVSEEAAYGGGARLTTGWWRDTLRIGASAYTSQALYTPAGRGGTGLLMPGGHGYWAPGEAFLEGNFGDHFHFKGPRQELELPFFNRHDIRMVPVVHEAYSLSFDGIPSARISAGHITRIKERTSEEFIPLSEAAGAEGSGRGASLLGMRYQWREEKSTIGALNAAGWDTFNTFYAETDHTWDLPGELELNTSSQFIHQESIGDQLLGEFETWSIGGQAALSLGGWVGTVAYTTVGQGNRVRNPWGGTPMFNSVMISDFNRAGEKALRFGLSYPFEKIGLPGVSAFANYVHGDTPDFGSTASPDEDELNVSLDLRPEKGPFEDFWLRLRYGWNDKEGGAYHENVRVILNYSRQF